MGFFKKFKKPSNEAINKAAAVGATIGAGVLGATNQPATTQKILEKDTANQVPPREYVEQNPEKYANDYAKKHGVPYTVKSPDGTTKTVPVNADKSPTWSHPDENKSTSPSTSEPWINPDTGKLYEPTENNKSLNGTNSADYHPDGRPISGKDRYKTTPDAVSPKQMEKDMKELLKDPDAFIPNSLKNGLSKESLSWAQKPYKYKGGLPNPDHSSSYTTDLPDNQTLSYQSLPEKNSSDKAPDGYEKAPDGYKEDADGSYILDLGNNEPGPKVEQSVIDETMEKLGKAGLTPENTNNLEDQTDDTLEPETDTPSNSQTEGTKDTGIDEETHISPEDIPTSPEKLEKKVNQIIATLARLLEKAPGILKGKNLVTLLTLTTSALAYNTEANAQSYEDISSKLNLKDSYSQKIDPSLVNPSKINNSDYFNLKSTKKQSGGTSILTKKSGKLPDGEKFKFKKSINTQTGRPMAIKRSSANGEVTIPAGNYDSINISPDN